MSDDELDPTLAAENRLFAGALEKFFQRYVLAKARLFSADTDEILEHEEVRDEQRRLARSQDLQYLEVLLETVRRAASFFAIRRFCRYAKALEDELIREQLARACVEKLRSVIGQSFALFDVSERVETWTAEFENWLVCELQRISDREIIRRPTDQQASDQRTQQIGDRAVSGQSPQSGSPGAPVQGEEVRHTPVSIIQRIRSTEKKALTVLIELFKAEHPGESDTHAILKGVDKMITDIGSEGEEKRVRKDVHDSVPERWKERIGAQASLFAYWENSNSKERGRIKTYVSDVKVIQ